MAIDERIEKVVAQAVEDANRYPFLFVGSGLSRRYCGLPSWDGLLETVCLEVLDNQFAYARYKQRAKVAIGNGEGVAWMPYVATLMENDVNDALFGDERFCDFRAKHEEEIKAGCSPMKLFIAELTTTNELVANDETAALSKVGREKLSGVITTNYDTVCEELFPTYKAFSGEGDLLFNEQSYAQEIYKIHGSVSNPDSMVLTSADYSEFDGKRKYLAAKLLTIFIEYPVIFLGYSLQDENIKAILEDIGDCLPADKLERLQRRMIFVQHGDQTDVGTFAMSFGDKMLSMTRLTTDDFLSIYETLIGTRKLYDTRFVREIRGSVFRLAERIDPTSDVVVSGVDNVLNNLDPDAKIVIGLATSLHNVGIPLTPEDIFEDVVLDCLHYEDRFIVENYLNRFVRTNAGAMPVFKYIRFMTEDEMGNDVLRRTEALTSIDAFRTNTIRKHFDRQRRKLGGDLSIAGIQRRYPDKSPFLFIPYLNTGEVDIDDLESILKDTLLATGENSEERKAVLKNTNFRKCVMIYDYLRYKRQEAPNLHH